jgi:LysM repeat protein
MLAPMNSADMGGQLPEPTPSRPAVTGADPTTSPSTEQVVPGGCPFLLAEPGGWRLDRPSRDHRCAAFSPPAPLAPEKQARLCLTPSHTGCATYLASLAAREARLGPQPGDRATRWGLARTTPVIEDPGGVRARLLATLLDRRRWPAIPAVILVTTLFTLALSGFRSIPADPAATSSPAPRTPAPTPALTPATTPAETAPPPSATPAPTVTPTRTAAPIATPAQAFRSYRVQPGDTLSAIASRFGVSIQSIVNLNNISNPNELSVGQVLRIPS